MRTIPFGRPMISEIERKAVLDVLDGPILVHGPVSERFEADFATFTGAPHAVSVSSCTAGMHLIWFSLGIGVGDEVVVAAQTHVATAHAVELTGARAVFADADAVSGNVDVAAVEAAITPRTRGIAVVHFLGEPADMPALVEVAQRHGLFLLEDCALAPGTAVEDVHAGLHGDAGVFSFYPVKHLTTAEGGMVITRDGDLAARLRRQRAFGVDRTPSERSIPGVYDVTMLGFNYRMNEIEAAIGVAQVARLQSFLDARRANFDALAQGLDGIDHVTFLAASAGERRSSCYCLEILLDGAIADRRHELVAILNRAGIGTSIYYPRPVPLTSYYAQRGGHQPGDFPNAERISDTGVALPVGPHLDVADMAYIADNVRSAAKELLS